MLFRTMLNIPSHSPKMLLNADLMGADVILFDLEDGVALSQKEAARDLLCAYLSSGLSRCPAMVRVNDVNTPFFSDDIAAVLPLPILGIMLPKMERPEELHYADEKMREVEIANGLVPGSRSIIGTAESALGVENAFACLSSCDRVIGCSFGSEDFAASLGVKRSLDNDELDYGRRHLVVGAPTQAEVRHALAVKAKMDEAMENGRGIAVLNGKMLDRPVAQQAEKVLAMARAAGIRIEEVSYE